ELLIVVDTKNSYRRRRSGTRAPELRSEESCGHAGEDHQGGESVDAWYAHASRESRNLRVVPFNGKRERGCTENAEVVGIVRVFPDVFAGEDEVAPECLLDPGMKFVAPSWTERRDT